MITKQQTQSMLEEIHNLSKISDTLNDTIQELLDWPISNLVNILVSMLDFPEESIMFSCDSIFDRVFSMNDETDFGELAEQLINESLKLGGGVKSLPV